MGFSFKLKQLTSGEAMSAASPAAPPAPAPRWSDSMGCWVMQPPHRAVQSEDRDVSSPRRSAAAALPTCDSSDADRANDRVNSVITLHAVDSSTLTDAELDNNSSNSSSSGGDCCAVCLEPLRAGCLSLARLATCLHAFHFDCVRAWAAITAKCPTCRAPFDEILHTIRTDADYARFRVEPSPQQLQLQRQQREQQSAAHHGPRHGADVAPNVAASMRAAAYARRRFADFPVAPIWGEPAFSSSSSSVSSNSSIIRAAMRRLLTPAQQQQFAGGIDDDASTGTDMPSADDSVRPYFSRLARSLAPAPPASSSSFPASFSSASDPSIPQPASAALPGVSNVLAQQIEWMDDVHWRRLVYMQNPATPGEVCALFGGAESALTDAPASVSASESASASATTNAAISLSSSISVGTTALSPSLPPSSEQLARVTPWIQRYGSFALFV
jgi:hypothetical protein